MKNNLTGFVYVSDGVEYCDWLQPCEVSKDIFDNSDFEIIKIIQDNKTITKTEFLKQLENETETN